MQKHTGKPTKAQAQCQAAIVIEKKASRCRSQILYRLRQHHMMQHDHSALGLPSSFVTGLFMSFL